MKTPIHLWIVGVLSLVWNSGGAVDYYMSQTRNEGYLAQLPQEAIDFLNNVPLWFEFAWAIGVWFSVLGSILLLLKSRFAGSAFVLSLLGLIASSIYTYGLAEQRTFEAGGTMALLFTIAIPVVLILLIIYSRAMTRRGVLS